MAEVPASPPMAQQPAVYPVYPFLHVSCTLLCSEPGQLLTWPDIRALICGDSVQRWQASEAASL